MGYAITKLCAVAGVARSAYYKWLNWTPSARELEIRTLAKEVQLRYVKRKGILGYRQMRTLGLKAVIRKKRPGYVKASEIHVAENVMNRNFDANSPNIKWCTDMTYIF